MREIHGGQAIQEALTLAMENDDRVFIAGEGLGISIHANPLMPTFGLLEKFGERRVRDTPVSEAAIAGLAVGSSQMGLLPVVEIMFFPFITLATDMLVNHAAKLRYLSGGRAEFPLTVRVKTGTGFQAGCQHSHHLEAWMAHVPGLKLLYPASPADLKGMLLTAIFDPDPVIVVEEMFLYWMKGEVEEGDVRTPMGKALVRKPGDDITIVAYGMSVYTALEAAGRLAQEGISAEVVDLRSLVPLDKNTILDSVRKTGRLITLHDANRFCGFGAEIAAMVAEEAFDTLKAPVQRVAAPDVPVPFTPEQEKFFKPDADNVITAVKNIR